MNVLDYVVLLASILGIAAYGVWRTRGRRDLKSYLKGRGDASWLVIGLSVMATQASAVTFLSTPGQGYESGLRFVQNYFGAPLALILICAVFLPIYRRMNVYTPYEFLGQRFDAKTRLLGASLFLLQRGLGAGITIYAPAIVLSTVFGWRLDATIVLSGAVVIVYTVAGGSDAVTHTQKYQLAIIFAGMAAAFGVLVAKLPVSLPDALVVAGKFHRLQAVDFSPNLKERYTFWSGTLGGMFLALSYFGTDQSQVQRYIGARSLRIGRLGLMFNAICKIPMQFFILLLGALLFVFFQFERPPVVFNQTAWARVNDAALEQRFNAAHAQRQELVRRWLEARGTPAEVEAKSAALAADKQVQIVREEAASAVAKASHGVKANDADYVFITFILRYLPHGLIGLLVAAFFAAALSSKAAELTALASTTVVDVYRHLVHSDRSDAHYVAASRWLTVFWGLVAIAFALFANLVENLIQAANIIGSIFYGVPLAIFLVAFFVKWVGGTAVFVAAIVAQVLVIVLYFKLDISYLWYNVIGCAACMLLAAALQPIVRSQRASEA